MNCNSTTKVVSFSVAKAAKDSGLEYKNLMDFITAHRALPEFQRIISKHRLEELVYERIDRVRGETFSIRELIEGQRIVRETL